MKASRWNCVLPLVLTVVTLSLMSERFALAQAGTGSIRGLVTDASGAVLPDVQIEATNVATQLKFSTTSTGAGVYALSSLPIGVYKVVVQHAGFKQFIQENVDIYSTNEPQTAFHNRINFCLNLHNDSVKVKQLAKKYFFH